MKTNHHFKQNMVAALKESLAMRKAPRLPAGGAMLWRWFLDLNSTRSYHFGGPNSIAYSEIEAYGRLHHIALQEHHIGVLRAMDEAYLERAHARTKPLSDGTKVMPPISARPISAGLFDAMMG
ncbi:phage tail assembly chaperone [Rhizobium rhizogenes]|uniref:phage tail assembly chaperone n=1 Tax=Rhizobium rhizogenes TaxID=359 RepID=UPI001574198B|nr:hypothetical protein [Rhizobium rhizogenes]NTI41610.1 hypothetical protein [Rhizobium rhizogenes]